MSFKSVNSKGINGYQSIGADVNNGFVDNLAVNPSPNNTNGPISFDLPDNIDTYGGNVPDNVTRSESREYANTYVYSTPGGHVIEYNDTIGHEKIMIRHSCGAGVQINPDGSIITSSATKVDIVNDGYSMTVHGDSTIDYVGDLTMNVKGDFNLNVEGTYNVTNHNYKHKVENSSDFRVEGNHNTIISKNNSNYVVGTKTDVVLDEYNLFSKGNMKLASEAELNTNIKGKTNLTSQTQVNLSSPDINVAAENLSVFGNTGTIGGENIVMYNYNMHTQHTVWSETVNTNVVYGDLEGTAAFAVQADVTNSQNYSDPDPGGGVGSAVGYTVDNTAVDTLATALPTGALLDSYLNKGTNGVRNVFIDANDVLKRSIDLSERNGNITSTYANTDICRRQLREKANRQNELFTGNAIANGELSSDVFKTTPETINGVTSGLSYFEMGTTPLGVGPNINSTKRFVVK